MAAIRVLIVVAVLSWWSGDQPPARLSAGIGTHDERLARWLEVHVRPLAISGVR